MQTFNPELMESHVLLEDDIFPEMDNNVSTTVIFSKNGKSIKVEAIKVPGQQLSMIE